MNANIPSPPTSVSTSAKSLLFKPKLEPLVEDERNVEFRSSFATSTFPHSTLPSITSFSSPSSVTSLPPISPLYLKKRVTNDSLYEDVSESDGDDDDVDGLKVWMENMKIKEASGDHLHEQKRLLPRSDLKLPSNARRVNEWRSIDVNEFPFKPLASASQHNLEVRERRWEY